MPALEPDRAEIAGHLLAQLLEVTGWRAVVDEDGGGLVLGEEMFVRQMRIGYQIVNGPSARVH